MLKRIRFIAAVAMTALSVSAHAALWSFSYTFDSGEVISGSFKGVAKGDYIEKIRDISVAFDGTPFVANPFIDAFGYNTGTKLFDAAVPPKVSPILELNNFIFVNTGELGVLNNDPINSFIIINDPSSTGSLQHPLVTGGFIGVAGASDAPGSQDRWVLTKANVAEPDTLAMLALALTGLAVFHRRKRLLY